VIGLPVMIAAMVIGGRIGWRYGDDLRALYGLPPRRSGQFRPSTRALLALVIVLLLGGISAALLSGPVAAALAVAAGILVRMVGVLVGGLREI
jgi:hypothetical protein